MSEAGRHIVCPNCAAVNRVPASKDASAGKCGKCHKPLFTKHAIPATSETFAKHIQQNVHGVDGATVNLESTLASYGATSLDIVEIVAGLAELHSFVS